MNNSRAEKLSKVVSAKVTPGDYNLCKRIATNMYEIGEIGRNSVSELVRVLVESLLSECRNKEEKLQRSHNSKDGINAQSSIEDNNKMQFPIKKQLFPMPLSLIKSQEYRHNQRYEQLEQQKERKKQEHSQDQQLCDILSKMPETPTLPPITKTKP
jgi:hypothetical protein